MAIDYPKIQRTLRVVDSFAQAEQEDAEYWFSRTPEERLAALELLRRINYGEDYTNARMSRTIEVLEQPWNKKPRKKKK